MANLLTNLLQRFASKRPPAPVADLPNETTSPSTETGWRPTPENSTKYLYRRMWVDPDLRKAILDIRDMDKLDGRVKKIHSRMASTAVTGGLKLLTSSENKKIIGIWSEFQKRLQLHRQEKLESHARGMAMEGNLPLQWVLGPDSRVVGCVRMPSESIVPKVGPNGQFIDPRQAYEQYDISSGQVLAAFALWQLTVVRLTPDNYDDMGALGRPYLDASRGVWRKLIMTEEDLVIRRRQRAPLRMSHVLEGASAEDLATYRQAVEEDQTQITTDYYLNKKGSVTAVQGDANLDQIADVAHLLDTFFAGSPAPKALFGYAGDTSRDILEDLKRDYFDEIDALQDTLSEAYCMGFRLELLLRGINPDAYTFEVVFAERRTDTPNQRADLALKYQAMGIPNEMVWDAAGLDAAEVRAQLDAEANSNDPYPEPDNIGPKVSITPGNAPKSESATSISN